MQQDASAGHSRSKVEMAEEYYENAKKYVSLTKGDGRLKIHRLFVEYFRIVNRALKEDEKGERMSALELYNKALNTVQTGLSVIQSNPQVNSAMHELKAKMEKY